MKNLDPLSVDFATRYPDAFARVLGRGDAAEMAQIIARLPAASRAGIVARLPVARIEFLLQSDIDDPAQWLSAAPFDDAVTLLSRMPQQRRLDIINAIADRDCRRRLLRHQRYPLHSVGALVRDVPLIISAGTKAVDAVAELRGLASDDQGPLVVVDAEGRYLGILDRWRLLLGNPPPGEVGDYVIDVAPLYPETPIVAAVHVDEWHRRNWLPVVDHRKRVIGGVSREMVFAAHKEVPDDAIGGGLLLELLAGVVRPLAALIENSLATRDRS